MAGRRNVVVVDDVGSPKCAVRVEYPASAFRHLQGLNKRIMARHMFIKELYEIDEIAVILQETAEQVTQWGLEEQWEKKRLSFVTSTDQAADILERKLKEFIFDLNDDKILMNETSTRIIERASKAIASLRADKATLSSIMSTMQIFVEYLKMTDPEMLLKFETYIDKFIEHRRKQAGI